MASIIKKVVELVRKNGILSLPRLLAYGLSEMYRERRLHIRTLGYLDQYQLGLKNRDSSFYAPTAYRDFHRAMKFLTIREGEDVFLDYGSGMGRVVVMAATFPFRRVIGIEVSEELNCIAEGNILRARKNLQCKDIELIVTDAAAFEVPSDVTVVYLYNPFRGVILSKVLNNLRESLQQTPRNLCLIFKNPVYFEELVDECPWLEPRCEFICVTGHRCVIYESKL